jgi:hypothetical protein
MFRLTELYQEVKLILVKKLVHLNGFQKEYEIAKSPAVYNTNRMYYYTIVRGTSNRMSDDRTFFYDPERNLAVLLTGGDF